LAACKETADQKEGTVAERWSIAKVNAWYENLPWLVGTNYTPSTAINQLEFWQADTFDPETIDCELGWSADLGMNLHRVYLHNLLWQQDSTGLLKRLDRYLGISDRHGIKTMFVLFDGVWNSHPKLGKQSEPVQGVHNSGWVQAPGAEILGDSLRHDDLKGYVTGVISHFAKDDRVLVWDLYNEPENVMEDRGWPVLERADKRKYELALIKKVFRWARETDPTQPLTVAVHRREHIENWGNPELLPLLQRFMLKESDVISFHCYDGKMSGWHTRIAELQKYGRPILCTEYLARPREGGTFENVLPLLKKHKIAAINWGLVSGKTNTIYPHTSWKEPFEEEPEFWHHDILRQDGTPFSESETEFIKKITGQRGSR
jgi:hypothetical protein